MTNTFAQEKTRKVKGIIVQEKSINKIGKEMPGPGDYYLKIKSKRYFIKFDYGSTMINDVEALLGEKRKFTVTFCNGLWDTDDPSVQSRVGDYVKIIEFH